MSTLGSKLTAGLRQVKEGAPASSPQPVASTSVPAPAPAVRAIAASADEQSPATTLYDPWKNVHPRRIWPD